MLHPETHAVTKENGPRPAGSPDHCFYCNIPVGGTHKTDCPLRKRTVMARVTIEIPWVTSESINKYEFYLMYQGSRSRSTWCAGNIIDVLSILIQDSESCLCGHVKVSLIGEATKEQEDEFNMNPRLING